MISKTIEICGFISVGDVGSPSSISRHLVLPLATEKTSSMQGISLEEDSDTDENGDEGKMPSFCVLLHGALKVHCLFKSLTIIYIFFCCSCELIKLINININYYQLILIN